jgi:hypothetical protein
MYFKKHGYVVIKGAASKEELARAEDIFWESAGSWYGVHKDKMDGWGNDTWSCMATTRTGAYSIDGRR